MASGEGYRLNRSHKFESRDVLGSEDSEPARLDPRILPEVEVALKETTRSTSSITLEWSGCPNSLLPSNEEVKEDSTFWIYQTTATQISRWLQRTPRRTPLVIRK